MEDEDSESDEDVEVAPRPKKRAAPARKPAPSKSRGAAASGAAPKPNGFTKPLRLSPEMAAWVGTETASRPDITKHLWAYVKSKDLQDPANKQFVLADETLKALTGEERFKAFTFSKLIKDHVLGYLD